MRPGQTIDGRFEIVRPTRGGASSVVFEGRDLETGRRVAVKAISMGRDDEMFLVRVRREIDILQKLSHPHVVRCIASGTADGLFYLALEWLEGQDLADYVVHRLLNLRESLEIGEQIASALAAAHALGVIHRDIKPANIFLIERGDEDSIEVRVLDFGVAKADQSAGVTRAGAILGTPSYMAPEQANYAMRVDGRADVFSLGVVLFELISGRLPWSSRSELARLARILVEDALPLREVSPDVPAPVAELVDQMLESDPAARVSSMTEVERRLSECLGELSNSELMQAYAVVQPIGSSLEDFVQQETAASRAPEPLSFDEVDRRPRIAMEQVDATQRTELLTDTGLDFESSVRSSLIPIGVPLVSTPPVFEDITSSAFEDTNVGAQGSMLDEQTDGFESGVRFIGTDDQRPPLRLERSTSYSDLKPGEPTESQLSHMLPQGSEIFGREAIIERLRNDTLRALTLRQATGCLIVGPAGVGKTRLRVELQRQFRDIPGHPLVLAARAEDLLSASPYAFIRRLLFAEGRIYPDDNLEERRRKIGDLVPGPELVARSLRRESTRARNPSNKAPGEERTRFIAAPEWAERPSVVAVMADAFDYEETDGSDDQAARASTLALLGEALQVPFPAVGPAGTALAHPHLMGAETLRAVDLVLSELAKKKGLVLLVDDAHLLDPQSAKAIAELGRKDRKLKVSVLCFAQPTILDESNPARTPLFEMEPSVVELPPIDERSAKRLVEALVPGSLAEEAEKILVDRARGNALYLEQLTRALLESRVLAQAGDGRFALSGFRGDTSDFELVPPTVAAAVRTRLRQLDTPLQRTLVAAAVFGDVFWAEGVAAITGERVEDAMLRLDYLIVRDFIRRRVSTRYRGTNEMELAHGVIRTVVLSKVKQSRRQTLEAKAVAYLELAGETDESTLASHRARAGDREDAVRLYAEAARRSAQIGGVREACWLAEQGLRLGADEDPQLRSELLESLASSHSMLRDVSHAESLIDEALGLDLPPARRLRFLLERASLHARQNRYDLAEARAKDALDLADEIQSPIDQAEARLARSEAHEAMADSRKAIGGYLSAKSTADSLGRREVLARVVQGLGRIGLASGDYRSAEARYREALVHAKASRGLDEAFNALSGLAEVKRRMGNLEEARDFLGAATKLAHGLEQDLRVETTRALIAAERGDVEESSKILREVIAAAGESPGGARACMAAAHLVLIEAHDDTDLVDASELEARLSAAIDRHDLGYPALTLPLAMALAWLQARGGDSDSARASMQHAHLRFAREGALFEVEPPRFLLARALVLEKIKASESERQSAIRAAVEQLDLISSRLERSMRGAYLDRKLARAVLELAKRVGLRVDKDAKSGRLSV